jgi:hypothetical protein
MEHEVVPESSSCFPSRLGVMIKRQKSLKGVHRNRCVPTGSGRTMLQLPLPPTLPGNDPHPFGFFDFAMLYVVILQLTLLALSPRVSNRILETLFPILLRRTRYPGGKAKKCERSQWRP